MDKVVILAEFINWFIKATLVILALYMVWHGYKIDISISEKQAIYFEQYPLKRFFR